MEVLLKSSSCIVTVLPKYGGMINSMIIGPSDHKTNIIYGYDDLSEIPKLIHEDFRSTKLSPFPNRVNNGKYNFENNDHQLDINFLNEGHAIHGLLYDKEFSICYQTNNQLELEYRYDGKFKGYPFPYLIKLAYHLIGNELRCTTFIKNIGSKTIPIGDGFHPYFRMNQKIDGISLQLPPVNLIEVDDRMIPNCGRSDYSNFKVLTPIGKTELDSCFEIKNTNNIVTSVLKSDTLQLELWQETGTNKYNYIQVYIPQSRDCIAWEPMTCPPDAFNNGINLIKLQPIQEIKLSFGIKVSF